MLNTNVTKKGVIPGFFDIILRRKRGLRVLAYHTVKNPDLFEKQIRYLKANFEVVGIDNLEDNLFNNVPLPPKALIITFDDGDISVYKNAMPVLEKYGLKSCVFVITSLINTQRSVWIKRLEESLMSNGKSYAEAREEVNRWKQLPNSERERRMIDLPNFRQEQLSTNHLNRMIKGGMFVGNHTHTHPMLDKCSRKEIEAELNQSQIFFKDLNLPGYKVFAYPNGNHSNETEALLRRKGIHLSFIFDHQVNKKKINPYKISRLIVNDYTAMWKFRMILNGTHSAILPISRALHKFKVKIKK